MDLDFDDVMTWGLRGYVQLVTAELGLSGECSYVQGDRPATAYLALDGRLPGFPERDVALLWDEREGWSAAVETHSGEDLIVQAHLRGDVLPPPRVVADWVRRLFRGDGQSAVRSARTAGGDIVSRVKVYASAATSPLSQTA
ncbi:DUF6292 family protein [Actinosynnema sp. CS-041913]|uniref:DUF6292 family protein n=1 Tax=Actinosynnema sp. CS-041913 TaxID=3239917 RepID=UPI003D8D6C08